MCKNRDKPKYSIASVIVWLIIPPIGKISLLEKSVDLSMLLTDVVSIFNSLKILQELLKKTPKRSLLSSFGFVRE